MTQPNKWKRPDSADVKAAARLNIPDLCAPAPVLIMILLVELLVMVHILAAGPLARFDWSQFAGSSVFALWIVLTIALMLCQTRFYLGRLELRAATTLILTAVAFNTLLSSLAVQTLLEPVRGVNDGAQWVARNVVIATVLAAITLRYFYLQQQLRLREQLELTARLDSLRARIRPHFFFNTLNTIASLIETRPEVAEEAVEDLAELFRASLKEGTESTSVNDEIHLTRLYLGIEKLRLQDRLSVEWCVDSSCLEREMPSLVLQPLVENAIQHGVAEILDGGVVTITISSNETGLHVSVKNPLSGAVLPSQGNNLALLNIEQRLNATYGTAAQLILSPSPREFKVELILPDRVKL